MTQRPNKIIDRIMDIPFLFFFHVFLLLHRFINKLFQQQSAAQCMPVITISKEVSLEGVLVAVDSVAEEVATVVEAAVAVVEEVFLAEPMIDLALIIMLNNLFIMYANFMSRVEVVGMEINAGLNINWMFFTV
jgi:hypothetical protein